jgi:uncharacterized paraquat-inducible protein A
MVLARLLGIIVKEMTRRTSSDCDLESEVPAMIEFACKLCGEKLSVPDRFAGRPFKCTKCSVDGVVPEKHDKIKFHCKKCGQGLRVPKFYAGKEGKCPKCKSTFVVPAPKPDPASASGTVTVVCSICSAVIHTPQATKGKMIACPKCDSYIQT